MISLKNSKMVRVVTDPKKKTVALFPFRGCLEGMSSFLRSLKSIFGGGTIAQSQARSIAKDRLSLMLVTQRSSSFLSTVDMNAFQSEVGAVVQKYMKIASDKSPQISGTTL
jgi:septum formation topological specificity factor MinE